MAGQGLIGFAVAVVIASITPFLGGGFVGSAADEAARDTGRQSLSAASLCLRQGARLGVGGGEIVDFAVAVVIASVAFFFLGEDFSIAARLPAPFVTDLSAIATVALVLGFRGAGVAGTDLAILATGASLAIGVVAIGFAIAVVIFAIVAGAFFGFVTW